MTSPKKKNNPPRKQPFKPTDDERRTVELMCAVGIPHEGIALCIRDGIDDKTLRKHFRRELDTSKIKAGAKIGGVVFQEALKGQAWACNLYTKTQMGWTEGLNMNHGVQDSLADLFKEIDGRTRGLPGSG